MYEAIYALNPSNIYALNPSKGRTTWAHTAPDSKRLAWQHCWPPCLLQRQAEEPQARLTATLNRPHRRCSLSPNSPAPASAASASESPTAVAEVVSVPCPDLSPIGKQELFVRLRDDARAPAADERAACFTVSGRLLGRELDQLDPLGVGLAQREAALVAAFGG